MTGQSFTDELARALAREDVRGLRAGLSAFFDWHEATRRGERLPSPLLHDKYHADRNFALVALALADYDDAAFLERIALGPLQQSLWWPEFSQATLVRIVAEARKSPRFQWMLGRVQPDEIRDGYAAAITDIVLGESTDGRAPLPPRPII